MIRKALLLRIFNAASMQRWNDKIRPVEFTELDKQAHKMMIAYFLGKFEEGKAGFNWIEIIEGGLFEFLQRTVLTDLKPPIFYKIKEDPDKYRQLNDWVFSCLESTLSPLGMNFCQRFRSYFSSGEESLDRRILNAAHLYATQWEFDILERANPEGYEIKSIKKELEEKQSHYSDLRGIHELTNRPEYRNFIDLCGQLRFQSRWSHVYRIPRTSVLGHLLFVSVFCYLFSMEINACERRRINNYFTGLFHDLPEVLTRDIISPVKKSVEGLKDLIKDYEKEMMEKEVYGLIPEQWHTEIRMFTEDEFESFVAVDGRHHPVSSEEINEQFNEDRFDGRDGELVRAADRLAAFLEAYTSVRNGSASAELHEALWSIRNEYGRTTVGGINFGEIYADFD